MADLKTTYKDDVLNESVNTRRKYNMIQNDDGTVSFEDVTVYSQIGDTFGAGDINGIAKEVNLKIPYNGSESGHTYEPWLGIVNSWERIPIGISTGIVGYGFCGYIGLKMSDDYGAFILFGCQKSKAVYFLEYIDGGWQYMDISTGESTVIKQ